jgi:hypothetical protein
MRRPVPGAETVSNMRTRPWNSWRALAVRQAEAFMTRDRAAVRTISAAVSVRWARFGLHP